MKPVPIPGARVRPGDGQPDTAKLVEIFERLESAYGYQGWWPLVSRAGEPGRSAEGYRSAPEAVRQSPHDRLEIAFGALLTQNTAWNNAAAALANLRAAGLLHAGALSNIDEGRLASLIRVSGSFRQKARKLRILHDYLMHGGFLRPGHARASSPDRSELLSLWGVGPETADVILLYAFDRPAFVVDAYTRRALSRVGLVPANADYAATQARIVGELRWDREMWQELHALFVAHAKAHCRKLPVCEGCPLRDCCERGRMQQT
jgi:endonuclease III related protein